VTARDGKNGRGPHDSPNGDEESVGHVDPSPELEEALREAAAAVPDPAERRARREAPAEGESAGPGPGEEGGAGALQEELAQARDRMLRLHADFDNFRKRAMKDREEALQYGSQNLVKDLLSVVDNLGRAIAHAQTSAGGDLQGLLQGVGLVWKELEGVLEKHHVHEIEAKGQTFNPARHEAMAQIQDPNVPPNTIVEVLQKGYRLRDRLLRPARVVVAKPPEEPGRDGGGVQ
jgi:molecular chaperone GrpE